MSFTQELTCRWSTSKWTPTKLLQGHLLHRSCYTGVQPTSRWSNCIWTLAISYFSSSSISVWRQGQPGGGWDSQAVAYVWPNAGFVCLWATLCGDRACRMGWNANLLCPQQPSAEIVWTPKHVVESDFFWARATLCRDRADRASKHVAKGKLNLLRRRAARSHEMRVKRQKLV